MEADVHVIQLPHVEGLREDGRELACEPTL
jgi:hypothetical protein